MSSSYSIGKKALESHRKLSGKIEIKSKVTLKSAQDLSIFYTPGVGAVSSYLASHKNETRDFTIKKNTVAVISDGSAVLGLGNIGPEGALPVMGYIRSGIPPASQDNALIIVSSGVKYPKHFLGVLLSLRSIIRIFLSVIESTLTPLGIYLLILPLVFSTVPFSHEW